MKIQEIIQSEQCRSLFTEIQAYSAECLHEYVVKVKKFSDAYGFPFIPKDIFDLVWGSIELTAEEIFMLDSPLLQRLRGIKQLGFACMVYCNADYSRFTHTLGVIEIAGRMAKKLNSNAILVKSEPYDFEKIVRLAALFHDVGHMYFSHVSEQYFTRNKKSKYYENINKALTHFRMEAGAPRAKLHEILSVMIVNTVQVRDMIGLIGASLLNHGAMITPSIVSQIVEYVSSLIIGIPCDTHVLPYSYIINGPLDADKIDYLSRDSATTKVPIAVDVARLIQKLTIVNYDKNRFKAQPIWNASFDNRPFQMMAIKYSARKTCWQLYMARSIMFESVYFHHKKLTAETMLRYGLEIFENHAIGTDFESFHSLLSIQDDFFNEHTASLLGTDKNRVLRSVLQKIHNRDLPKRVASISMGNMYSKIDVEFHVVYCNFEDEVILNKYSEAQIRFFNSLKNEIGKAAALTGRVVELKDAVFSFITSMPPDDEKNDMDMILIENGNDMPQHASEVFKGEPWMQGKENKQHEYYLVTDLPDRDLVFAALEKVFYHGDDCMMLKLESVHCSKYSKADILKLKYLLLTKGYYDDAVDLISDELLWEMIDRRKFDSVLDKYRSFQGTDGTSVVRESLFAYLRQFLRFTTDENLFRSVADGILRMLSINAIYIDRAYFQTNAKSLFAKVSVKYPESTFKKQMIKLGSERDSSTSWSYYINDIPDKTSFNYIDLETALQLDPANNVLVFFDDGAYSGKQVISIFQEMMGIPIEKRTTNEIHGHALNDAMKENLKKSNIVLAYLCFNEGSKEFIISQLNQLGIENVCIFNENCLNAKIFDSDDIFSDAKQRELVKSACSEIAESVLLSTKMSDAENFKSRWDAERVRNSSLGYNDAQQVVVFERNIPTYSITALWANGTYKDIKWRGLFQRTNKD